MGESPGTPKRSPALTAGQWQLLTELLCHDPATPELGAVLIIAQMGIVTPKWSCHPLSRGCYLPDRDFQPPCPHMASAMSPVAEGTEPAPCRHVVTTITPRSPLYPGGLCHVPIKSHAPTWPLPWPHEPVKSLDPLWTLPCPQGAPCPHMASGMSPRAHRAPCPHAASVLRVQEDVCAEKSQSE